MIDILANSSEEILVLVQTDKNRRDNDYQYPYEGEGCLEDKSSYCLWGWAWGYGVGAKKIIRPLESNYVVLKVKQSDGIIQVWKTVKFRKYVVVKWFDSYIEAWRYIFPYYKKFIQQIESDECSVISQTGDYSVATQNSCYSDIEQIGNNCIAGQTKIYATASQTGKSCITGQIAHHSVVEQTGHMSVVAQTGHHSTASQSGRHSVCAGSGSGYISQTGDYSVIAYSGQAEICQTGLLSACAINSPGSVIDVKCGCVAVSAFQFQWVVRPNCFIVQIWQDYTVNAIRSRYFSGKHLIKGKIVKEGQTVVVNQGEIGRILE